MRSVIGKGSGLITERLTGTAQVGSAGARLLYWLTTAPNAAACVVQLADAAAGSGTPIWEWKSSTGGGKHCVFDPPMEFATGIYLEAFTNMTSVTFGYAPWTDK